MSDLSSVRVNGQRQWDAPMEMTNIGAPPKGGRKRFAVADVDKHGREWFRVRRQRRGRSVKVDETGDMFARRLGVEDDLAPVTMGSRLDAQPTGGEFDGALGACAPPSSRPPYLRLDRSLGVRPTIKTQGRSP